MEMTNVEQDLEDLAFSTDPQFLRDYKDAEDDARNGRTIPADELFAQLDVENG